MTVPPHDDPPADPFVRVPTSSGQKLGSQSPSGHQPSAEERYLRSGGLAPVPAYPSGQVGGPLGALVASSALPDALLGGAGLAVLASLCGNAEIVLPGGDIERPALWVPVIAPSGGGKTPALEKRAMAPLFDLDSAARGQYDQDIRAWKALPGETRGDRPADPALLIRHPTIETLPRFLYRRQGHGGCGLIYAEELHGFLSSFGLYKKGSGADHDKNEMMELWNAQTWGRARVGNASDPAELGVDVFIPRCCVSVLGGLQPHLAAELGDADSGMAARWLPHYSEAQEIPWDSWTETGRAEWAAAVAGLHARRRQRRRWSLSPVAERELRQAQASWKAEGRAEVNATARAALRKADIHAARVAVVLAESAVQQASPGGNVLGPGAVRAAAAIVSYSMDVFRAFPSAETFALSYRDDKLSAAVEKLRQWLEARPGKRAARRDIYRAHVAGVRKASEVTALLAEYCEVYAWRIVREEHEGNTTTVVYAPSRQPGGGAEYLARAQLLSTGGCG